MKPRPIGTRLRAAETGRRLGLEFESNGNVLSGPQRSREPLTCATTVCATVALGVQRFFETAALNPTIYVQVARAQRQGASPDGGSFRWIPFEERAQDLGCQSSTASTGRRGLAWADSLGQPI